MLIIFDAEKSTKKIDSMPRPHALIPDSRMFYSLKQLMVYIRHKRNSKSILFVRKMEGTLWDSGHLSIIIQDGQMPGFKPANLSNTDILTPDSSLEFPEQVTPHFLVQNLILKVQGGAWESISNLA